MNIRGTTRLKLLVVLLAVSVGFLARADSPFTVLDAQVFGYFERLDYWSPKIVEGMPELESFLVDAAEYALPLPDSDPYLQENALIFIYAALYMDNLLEAHRLGFISFSKLTEYKQLSKTGIEIDEIHAREKKILAYVDRASQLRPNDIRMGSWVYGMKIKHIGAEYVDSIIKMVEERQDTFSLISALTVTRDLVLKPEHTLVLDEMVKKFTSLASPCFKGSTKEQCRSPRLAPFAAQTGVLMLADYRLRMAARDDTSRTRTIGRFFARMLYNSTDMVWMKDSTPEWRNRDLIEDRVKLTRGDNFSPESVMNFWQSHSSRAIYHCTSCHSSPVRDAPVAPPQFLDWGFVPGA